MTLDQLRSGVGLLTNDALILAFMQAHRISNLASNDAHFDGLTGLTRYVCS